MNGAFTQGDGDPAESAPRARHETVGGSTEVPFPVFQRWGRAAAVLIALFVPLMVFTFEDLAHDLYTLEFVQAGLPVSDTEVFLNHARLRNVSSAAVVLGAGAAALWLLWQYRVHANLIALGVQRLRFGPVTSVVSWLVPVANLVLPLLAIRELWRASDPFAEEGRWWKNRTSPLVWVWWASFLAGLFFVARASLLAVGAESPGELIARDHAFRVAALVALPAATLPPVLIALIDRRFLLALDRARFPDWRGWSER